MDIDTFFVDLPHGIRLACRAAGAADSPRRVVLLHGFPEGAFVWDTVMRGLAPQARCVAPFLRGYAPSSAPAEVQAYRAKHLVQDITALIDHLGGHIDVLVAHDWGGGIAWNLAALHPQRIGALVIVNSPHPGALLRELRHNPEQRAASAYMDQWVAPDSAQRLAARDFEAMWQSLQSGGPAHWLTDALRAQYRAVWSSGLDGALNYYRASPLRADSANLMQIELPESVVRVRVPTTVVWGMNDHALLPGMIEGLSQWVQPLQVVRVLDASHWIVHERPEIVQRAIAEALTQPSAR